MTGKPARTPTMGDVDILIEGVRDALDSYMAVNALWIGAVANNGLHSATAEGYEVTRQRCSLTLTAMMSRLEDTWSAVRDASQGGQEQHSGS